MIYRRILVLLQILLLSAPAIATSELEQNQAQLQQLQRKIKQLQQQLRTEVGERDNLRDELEQGEQAIAALHRDLSHTRASLQRQTQRLATLRGRATEKRQGVRRQRRQLVRLIRAKYMAGRHEPLKILLNQQDPAAVGRMFSYYRYLAKARNDQLSRITADLADLALAENELIQAQRELEQLAATQKERREQLQAKRSQRQTLLAKLNNRIASDDLALRGLQADAERLASLLHKLRQQLKALPQAGRGFAAMRGRLPLPVAAPIQARFGQSRRVPGTFWRGLLFRAAAGTPVRAIYPGRVVYADWLRGFGLLLIVDHGQGYMSLYSHNQELLKGVGAVVAGGEKVALVGDSGGLAQAGLYFELRHNGTPRDPLRWCRLDNEGQ